MGANPLPNLVRAWSNRFLRVTAWLICDDREGLLEGLSALNLFLEADLQLLGELGEVLSLGLVV